MARSDWRISEIIISEMIISEIMLINEWICEEQRRTGAYYIFSIPSIPRRRLYVTGAGYAGICLFHATDSWRIC